MPDQKTPEGDGDLAAFRLSRRGVVAWSVPVIVVAAGAPAFAASTDLTGVQQVSRTAADAVDSTGTVTNGSTSPRDVTLTWSWLCDSSGAGAGRFVGGTAGPQGWTFVEFVFVASGGNSQRGVRLVATQTIPAGGSVPFPTVTLQPSAATVTGLVTATLSAPAPATVIQPVNVRWPAFTGGRSARRAPSTSASDVHLAPPG